MLSGISGFHSPYTMYRYGGSVSRTPRVPAEQNQEAQSQEAQSAVAQIKNQQSPAGTAAGFPASSQASSFSAALPGANEEERPGLLFRQGTDPVELAVRMRIQYEDPADAKWPEQTESAEAAGAQSVQEAAEEGECQTCERRKYQDGSDDMGVSFQTPTHISPEEAPAAVRGHEMEHVYRNQAKAEREGREVISQDVTLNTSVCPECGKVYVSGGNTRTVTAAKQKEAVPELPEQPESPNRRPFSAVA